MFRMQRKLLYGRMLDKMRSAGCPGVLVTLLIIHSGVVKSNTARFNQQYCSVLHNAECSGLCF